jgi:hypothetical protein
VTAFSDDGALPEAPPKLATLPPARAVSSSVCIVIMKEPQIRKPTFMGVRTASWNNGNTKHSIGRASSGEQLHQTSDCCREMSGASVNVGSATYVPQRHGARDGVRDAEQRDPYAHKSKGLALAVRCGGAYGDEQ